MYDCSKMKQMERVQKMFMKKHKKAIIYNISLVT